MAENKETIYVYLMSEGPAEYRPVNAEAMGNSLFKITSENNNLDNEKWEFTTGEVVRCEPRTLFDCTHSGCLVAVEKV